MTDIVKMGLEDGKRISPVVVSEAEFKGVNSKFDLANAEVIKQSRTKRELMQSGVTMRLPDTIYIDCQATFEGESILENGVTILGKAKIKSSHSRQTP